MQDISTKNGRPGASPATPGPGLGSGWGLDAPAVQVLNTILGLLAATLTIATLVLGQDLIVPLVLAVLLAFVLAPIVVLLRKLYVPRVLAVVAGVLLAAAAMLGLGMVMARQAGRLVADLPAYQQNLQAKLQALRLGELMREAELALRDLRQMVGEGFGGRAGMPGTGSAPVTTTVVPASGSSPIEVLQNLAGPVLAPFATAGIVVLFAIIVLIYREDLRDRVIRLAGSEDLHRTTLALNDAARRLSRLFLAQVALNSLLGVAIGLVLWWLGLPSPALWGILAGLMRFVPFFGTFVALVPPLLLAVAVDPGWSMALWVLALFLVVEPLMVQGLEPAVYGHSTGLSPVAVLVAATFWTFLWGPIGLLLATPLTVCLVVLGRHVPRLQFLDVLLGDSPSLQPEESLYQRALEGDAAGLQQQARLHLRRAPALSGYHNSVVLPALALADRDWAREVLEPERLEIIRDQLETLLTTLAPPRPDSAGVPLLCSPGRGPLDDLAADLAVQAIQAEGMAALAMPEAAEPDPALAASIRLCCISVLEANNTADGIRYLVRRWQKRLPEASIVVGLWQASADSALLQSLRQEGTGQTIVTSLSELAALCRVQQAPLPAPEAVPEPAA